MNRKILSLSKGFISLPQGLLGVILLISLAVVLNALLSSCVSQTPQLPSSSSSPTTAVNQTTPTINTTGIPFAGSRLPPTEAKYRLINYFGDVFYCDPDIYPVQREISPEEFAKRYSAIEQSTEEFQAILKHNNLVGISSLSDAQKRIVYNEHKKLGAISLEPSGEEFKFKIVIPVATVAKTTGDLVEGSINSGGAISISKKESILTSCPRCLQGDARISTPLGEIAIRDLQKGMPVWTIDSTGQRRATVILLTVRRSIVPNASLVHMRLDDGRELIVSPGHPTVAGRPIGNLFVGDILDGGRIVFIETTPATETSTFDILPSGETGAYWANGILLKSTLSY